MQDTRVVGGSRRLRDVPGCMRASREKKWKWLGYRGVFWGFVGLPPVLSTVEI